MNFAEKMKQHQLDWALHGGVPQDQLEIRHEKISHVLKSEHRKNNLFKPEWWRAIEGAEHIWARALNSSQCFAVNLFMPAAERPDLAKKLLESVVGTLPSDIDVGLEFEHTPPQTSKWLGERGHQTQVDVFFTAKNKENILGHLLVEVKLTESEFGSCRGFETGKNRDNPHPEKCRNGAAVIDDPESQCWLVEAEGRKYWDIIQTGDKAFDFSALEKDDPCPFGIGLYQLLRNHALSQSLLAHTQAEWSYFAVCAHPQNEQVRHLKQPVAGSHDVVESFRKLAGADMCRELAPHQVIEMTEALDPSLSEWAAWMRKRYLLAA